MRLTAGEIAGRVGGRVEGDASAAVELFDFDSRSLRPGACFVALKGHRDGHDFVEAAFAKGALVALVGRPPAHPPQGPGRALVVVDDPLDALASLARRAREDARNAGLTVVGVAGSTGKTSTKDLLRAALTLRRAHANHESFNNEFGLPLTILNMPDDTGVLVTELGERLPGDVAALCAVARPDAGVVTNVGLAHAEHLGGPGGVADAMAELLEALPPTGFAVLDADDPWTSRLAARTTAEVVTVGFGDRADHVISGLSVDARLHPTFELSGVAFELGLHGAHQVRNAAMAAVVAHRLGVDWADAALLLREVRSSRWRMELRTSPGGVTVLNDAYNANPASTRAALEALAHLSVEGRRVAVLGDMRELGEHAVEAHAEIGRLARELGIDGLVAVGDGGRRIAEAADLACTALVDDAAAALHAVVGRVGPGDAVLVKASRALGLEAVAEGLLAGSADRPRSGRPAT